LFSYVDQEIRKKLKTNGFLVTLDEQGRPVEDRNGCDNGHGPFISLLGPVPLPQKIDGEERVFSWYAFVRRTELSKVLEAAKKVADGQSESFRVLLQTNMSVNSVLTYGDFAQRDNPLVRVHSSCVTSDVFGSARCECGPQLRAAFERVVEEGGGALVYMSSHEGRGIGLWAKAITYLLQDMGQDTYQANVSLGLPEDSRDFTDAAIVLKYLLKGKPIRLLSNNLLKRDHLEQAGQPVSEMIPHVIGVSERNIGYMRAKREKGHLLPDL
jgi:GTP cyclohydrolase II